MSIRRAEYDGRQGGLEPRGAGMQPTRLETQIEVILNRAPQVEHDVEAIASATGSTTEEARVALLKLRVRGAAAEGAVGWMAGQR